MSIKNQKWIYWFLQILTFLDVTQFAKSYPPNEHDYIFHKAIKCIFLQQPVYSCSQTDASLPSCVFSLLDSVPESVKKSVINGHFTVQNFSDLMNISPSLLHLVPTKQIFISGSNISVYLQSRYVDPFVAVKLLNSLTALEEKQSFLESMNGDELDFMVQSIIASEIISWEKSKDWNFLQLVESNSNVLFQIPPEFLLSIGSNGATEYLYHVATKISQLRKISVLKNLWRKNSRYLQRTWAVLVLREFPEKVRWDRYNFTIPGLTLDELKNLEAAPLLSKDLRPAQIRTVVSKFLEPWNEINFQYLIQWIEYLLPSQIKQLWQINISSLPVQVNETVSYVSAKQIFVYLLHRIHQENSKEGKQISFIGLKELLQLKNGFVSLLPLKIIQNLTDSSALSLSSLQKIDGDRISLSTAYYLTSGGAVFNLEKPEKKIINMFGFIKAIPTAKLISLESEMSSLLLHHLLQHLPGDNIPRNLEILKKSRKKLGSVEDFLKFLLKNKDRNSYFSLFSPKDVAQVTLASIDSLAADGFSAQVKGLPQHILTLILSNNLPSVVTWQNTLNGSDAFQAALLGLSCTHLSKIESSEFISIIGVYNSERLKRGKVFPKNLQRCGQLALTNYLLLKSSLYDRHELIDLLEPSDIEAVGGFILASLPAEEIFQAKYRREILSAIGQLSLPELLLAASREHLISVTDIFTSKDNLTITDLLIFKNLIHFVSTPNFEKIRPKDFQYLLESDIIDKRLCANAETRKAWSTLLISTYGPLSQWNASQLESSGDMMISFSPKQLEAVSSSQWQIIADIALTQYDRKVEWLRPVPFYEACLSTIVKSERDSYLQAIQTLSGKYFQEVKKLISSVNLDQNEHLIFIGRNNDYDEAQTPEVILPDEDIYNSRNDSNELFENPSETPVMTGEMDSSNHSSIYDNLEKIEKSAEDYISRAKIDQPLIKSFTVSVSNENDLNSISGPNELSSIHKSFSSEIDSSGEGSLDSSATEINPPQENGKTNEADLDNFDSSEKFHVFEGSHQPVDVLSPPLKPDIISPLDESGTTLTSLTTEESIVTLTAVFNNFAAHDISRKASHFENIRTLGSPSLQSSSSLTPIFEQTTLFPDLLLSQNNSVFGGEDLRPEIIESESEGALLSGSQINNKEPSSSDADLSSERGDFALGEVTALPNGPLAKASSSGEKLASTGKDLESSNVKFSVPKFGFDFFNLFRPPTTEKNEKSQISEELDNLSAGLKNLLGIRAQSVEESSSVTMRPNTSSSWSASESTSLETEVKKVVTDRIVDVSPTKTPIESRSVDYESSSMMHRNGDAQDFLNVMSIRESNSLAPSVREFNYTPNDSLATEPFEASGKTTVVTEKPFKTVFVQDSTKIFESNFFDPAQNDEPSYILDNIAGALNEHYELPRAEIIQGFEQNYDSSVESNSSNSLYRDGVSHVVREFDVRVKRTSNNLGQIASLPAEQNQYNNISLEKEVICDSVKTLGASAVFAIKADDINSMDNEELLNCIEDFGKLDLPFVLRELIWQRIKSVQFLNVALGNLVAAWNVDDVQRLSLDFNEDWSLELLYLLSKHNKNRTVGLVIIDKLKVQIENYLKKGKEVPEAALVAMGPLVCHLNQEELEAVLKVPGIFMHVIPAVSSEITGCPLECLAMLSNLTLKFMDSSDSWTADAVSLLGPIPAGLNEKNWNLLVSQPDAVSALQPEALKCLPISFLQMMPLNKLAILSPVAIKALSDDQFLKLNKSQQDILLDIKNERWSLQNSALPIEAELVKNTCLSKKYVLDNEDEMLAEQTPSSAVPLLSLSPSIFLVAVLFLFR